MDTCFNSHALRQFEHDEAEAERRVIDIEESVLWQFTAECVDSPDRIAAIINDYEVDLSPILALVFKPLAHAELAAGRIHAIRECARQCFHRYLDQQIREALDK